MRRRERGTSAHGLALHDLAKLDDPFESLPAGFLDEVDEVAGLGVRREENVEDIDLRDERETENGRWLTQAVGQGELDNVRGDGDVAGEETKGCPESTREIAVETTPKGRDMVVGLGEAGSEDVQASHPVEDVPEGFSSGAGSRRLRPGHRRVRSEGHWDEAMLRERKYCAGLNSGWDEGNKWGDERHEGGRRPAEGKMGGQRALRRRRRGREGV